jgi:type IV fimbrial biogenesis protein FimT
MDYQEGRSVLARSAPDGFSLIELMVGIAIVAILMFVALPNFSIFLQNTQIRNAAESTLQGITLARAEAIRRNVTVRFQLVSDLTSGCTLSATSLNWVVSLADATGQCDQAPSDTTPPQIIQTRSGSEGAGNIALATSGGSSIVFNSLGRMVGAGITQLDFSNATGTCVHVDANGTMRCLRIIVSTGGQARLCDPKVTDATDPRICA